MSLSSWDSWFSHCLKDLVVLRPEAVGVLLRPGVFVLVFIDLLGHSGSWAPPSVGNQKW